MLDSLTQWLNSAAPNGLSVMVHGLVPAIAFGLPWLHARRISGPAGKARRNAILIWAVPVLVAWLALNSLLAPAHHVAEIPDYGPEPVVMARNPRSVAELLIRAGVGAFGTAVILFGIGAIASRKPPELEDIPDA